MSLLTSLLGVLGNPNQQSGGSGAPNALLDLLSDLLEKNGGVQGLMQKFSNGGLGDLFASWVGTGPNQPVGADQINQALGSDQIAAIASKLGIDSQQAVGLLSQLLPGLIDRLTPDGRVPESSEGLRGLAAILPDLLGNLGGLQAGGPENPPPAA